MIIGSFKLLKLLGTYNLGTYTIPRWWSRVSYKFTGSIWENWNMIELENWIGAKIVINEVGVHHYLAVEEVGPLIILGVTILNNIILRKWEVCYLCWMLINLFKAWSKFYGERGYVFTGSCFLNLSFQMNCSLTLLDCGLIILKV